MKIKTLVALLFLTLSCRGQDFIQANIGMGVGRYSSLSTGGQVDVWRRNSNNFLKGITYQHQRYLLTGATDVPKLDANYHSLLLSVGYEAKLASWGSLVFTVGTGITHTYTDNESRIGPSAYGQFIGLVHLGEKCSLVLPVSILPKSGLVAWFPGQSSDLFYKIELLPLGLRVKL